MSYKTLDIFQLSLGLFYKTHAASLKLPKYELYALGDQLRRASDSVNTNIVEGYGRRRYKQDFIKFLVYSHASNDETLCLLDKIIYLYPNLNNDFIPIREEYDMLGAKINKFIQYVEENWKVPSTRNPNS